MLDAIGLLGMIALGALVVAVINDNFWWLLLLPGFILLAFDLTWISGNSVEEEGFQAHLFVIFLPIMFLLFFAGLSQINDNPDTWSDAIPWLKPFAIYIGAIFLHYQLIKGLSNQLIKGLSNVNTEDESTMQDVKTLPAKNSRDNNREILDLDIFDQTITHSFDKEKSEWKKKTFGIN